MPFKAHAESMTVRVGYFHNEGLLFSSNSGNYKSGYGYEYLQKIAGYTGWSYEYVHDSLDNLLQRMENSEIDMIVDVSYSPEMAERVAFSDYPMGDKSFYIFAMLGNDSVGADDYKTLNGKKIGVMTDPSQIAMLQEWLGKNDLSCEIVTFNNKFDMIKLLELGNIDMVVQPDMNSFPQDTPIAKIGNTEFYLTVSKNRTDLQEGLRAAQREIYLSSPRYNELLYNKYFSNFLENRRLSDTEQSWVSKKQVLKVGCLKDDSPFSDEGDWKNGKASGVVSLFIDNMIRKLEIPDLDVSYVLFDSYSDMLSSLKQGEIDAAFPLYGDLWLAESRQVLLSNTALSIPMVMLYKDKLSEEKMKNICVSDNRVTSDYVRVKYSDTNVHFLPHPDKCIENLLAGANEVTITNGYRANMYVADQNRYEDLRHLELPERAEIVFGIRKDAPQLMGIINRGIALLPKADIDDFFMHYTASSKKYTSSDFFWEYRKEIGVLFIVFIAVMISLVVVFKSRMRLAEISEQLAAVNADLQDSLQNEKQMKQAIEDAFEAANRASQAKSEFLSIMSHDIRTPMNGIIGMTSIAMSNLGDWAKVSDCLGKILSASKHLLNLINEILDMSKIEAGKIQLDEIPFNLPEQVDNIVTMINSEAQKKGHTLNVVTSIENEAVIGDSLRLRQVMMNILSNAVKYTPDGGLISFSVIEKPSNISRVACYDFICEDNGQGMSDEFRERIFEPFSREEDGRLSKVQGTGLGMTITRNIVKMMGGEITVDSAVGVGSVFSVTLFLKIDENNAETEMNRFDGMKALVVAQNEMDRNSAISMLEKLGVVSDAVVSPEEAVRAVNTHHEQADDYYVIIVVQAGNDSEALLDAVRDIHYETDEKTKIVIAATDWMDYEQEARNIGANGFINKPFFKSRFAKMFDDLKSESGDNVSVSPLEALENLKLFGKRALLVEDNDLNAEIATEILTMTGIEVEYAADGKIAVDMVEKAEDNYYDIVFMDIQMPNMNGYEATRAIRALPRDCMKTLPIIAMTANAFAEDVMNAREAGMDEHVAKPIDVEVLYNVLVKWLS